MSLKKMVASLSSPAWLTMVGFAVVIAVVLIPMDLNKYDERTDSFVRIKYSLPHRLSMVLVALFPLILTVYNIQCVTSGKCDVWAWFQAILSLMWVISFLTLNFLLMSVK
jgi:hypothetical protein